MSLLIDAQPVPLEITDDEAVRVRGTRVTLDTIISAYLDGDTAEEIAEQYPTLALADIYAVISFYLRNRRQVDDYLAQREEQREAIRRENQQRFPQEGLRDRLLARLDDA
jgi:uncharacterized protein (DUF433 family)